MTSEHTPPPHYGGSGTPDEQIFISEKGVHTSVESNPDLVSRLADIVMREHLDISLLDMQAISSHLNERSLDDALQILKQTLEDHEWDPNFDATSRAKLEALVQGPEKYEGTDTDYELEVKLFAALVDDWSPYVEVRGVTSLNDDPDENCETFRVYVIGIVWGMVGAVIGTFFFNRFPSISLSSTALQLFIYLSGRAWEFLPDWGFTFRGTRHSLSPGKWTFKEQMLATLAMSVSAGTPYSVYTLTSQKNENFYGFTFVSFGYAILLTLSSQFMGFGIAGIVRSYLVYPVQCVWFTILPSIKVNRTLVDYEPKQNINGWTMKTFPFFWLFFWISFAYYWIPDFLFGALSYFNWMTWIKPDNVRLAIITGSITGLAVNPISSFDWNIINQSGMIVPFYTTANQFGGMLISFVAILIIFFTNQRWTAYLPINSNSLFDNTGGPYQVKAVLNERNQLDEEMYQAYSPPYYSAANLAVYGAFFALYPASFVYALLYYGRLIVESSKRFVHGILHPQKTLNNFHDPFSRRVRRYKEVPEWYFIFIFVASVAMAIGMVEGYKFTDTPVWVIFLSIGLNLAFMLPFGYLYATTGLSVEVNVLIELIIGYALPGNGNALMIGKTYATNFLSQAENYITNQKQSHYTSIPPRALFRVQIISVILSCFVSMGILIFQLNGGVHNMCDPKNTQKFTCAGSRTFFSASVLWGVIGPKRMFDGLYPAMKYCFLIGALLPVPFYVIHRWGPRWTKSYHPLLILSGCLNWAPYNFMYYLPNLYLAAAFNLYVRHRFASWWQKYNYLLSTALTAGVAWSAFIMFFSTQYKHIASVDWWGNNVPFEGVDAEGSGIMTLAEGEVFGPQPGHYP